MIYFSNTLFQHPAAFGVISSLDATISLTVFSSVPRTSGCGILCGADRLRKLVSFRYEPSYLKNDPDLRTNFRKDLAPQLGLPVTYSNINLDGGNVVFSPSGERVLISDRVFSENPECPPAALVRELSELAGGGGFDHSLSEKRHDRSRRRHGAVPR